MFHLSPTAVFEGVSYQHEHTLCCSFLLVMYITPLLSLVDTLSHSKYVWTRTSHPSTWSLGFHIWIKGKLYRWSQWSFSPWSMGYVIHLSQWGHRLCAIRVTAWCFIQRFISSSSFLPWFHDLRNFHSQMLLPSSPEVNLPQVLDTSLLQCLWCPTVQILL